MKYEECKKEFVKLSKSIARQLHRYDVIRDFAEVSRIAIHQNLTPFGTTEDEDRYMQIIKRYERDDLNSFAKMMSLVQIAYQDRYGDFLGECLMELDMGNKDFGQFFSPYSLSQLCAEMTVQVPDDKDWFTLSEPAVGGGAMVIAAHDMAKKKNVDMFAVCVELSHMTADLCYINLASAGVSAQVIQGNTLTMEMGRCYPTPALCNQKWNDRLYGVSVTTLGFDNIDSFISAMGEPDYKCNDYVEYSGVRYAC